ncbi:hypothetical protein HDU85_005659 [Gaertneriomyces sp. JEL0708]|nr:hypothetical protein HDU85_005659 [Gaertneriomyces sp. JEL0708]
MPADRSTPYRSYKNLSPSISINDRTNAKTGKSSPIDSTQILSSLSAAHAHLFSQHTRSVEALYSARLQEATETCESYKQVDQEVEVMVEQTKRSLEETDNDMAEARKRLRTSWERQKTSLAPHLTQLSQLTHSLAKHHRTFLSSLSALQAQHLQQNVELYQKIEKEINGFKKLMEKTEKSGKEFESVKKGVMSLLTF